MYRIFLLLLPFLACVTLPGCSGTDAPDKVAQVALNEVQVKKGAELVHGLAACGRCHGVNAEPLSPLIGGRLLRDRYGDIEAPNLTSTHLGAWTISDLKRLFRSFERPNGEAIATEHHDGYQWLSDSDMFAIASYLKSLPASGEEREIRHLSTFARYTSGLTERRPKVTEFVPEITFREEGAYGKYLLENVALCTQCHNTPETLFSSAQYLQGGQELSSGDNLTLVPNITNSEIYGIGDWSQDNILRYLQSGITPENQENLTQLCPTNFFSRAPTEHLRAIALFLRSVGDE